MRKTWKQLTRNQFQIKRNDNISTLYTIFSPPENCAGDHRWLGEGEEWDEVRGQDAEQEDVAELPARGHDHGHLVVDKEHREDLDNDLQITMILKACKLHAL